MNVNKEINRQSYKTFFSFVFVITLVIVSMLEIFRLTIINSHDVKFGYSFTEWIINYSGGFVRRGFSGYIFSFFDKDSMVPIVNTFVMLLYLANISLAILLAKKAFNSYLVSALVILAPAGFVQMAVLVDPDYCFARKEMIFYLFSSYCALKTILNYRYKLTIDNIQHKQSQVYFFITVIFGFSAVAILIHEALIFFSFPFLIVIICLNGHIYELRHWGKILFGYIVLVLVLTTFMASHHGTPEIAKGILDSLPAGLMQTRGFETTAIEYLAWTVDHQISTVVDDFKTRAIILTTQAIPILIIYICCFAIVCRKYVGMVRTNFDPILVGMTSLLFISVTTSPILFGIDWNRWISSTMFHSVILVIILTVIRSEDVINSLVPATWRNASAQLKSIQLINLGPSRNNFVVFALILVMIWIGISFKVGFCCEQYIRYHGALSYLDAFFDIKSVMKVFLGI